MTDSFLTAVTVYSLAGCAMVAAGWLTWQFLELADGLVRLARK